MIERSQKRLEIGRVFNNRTRQMTPERWRRESDFRYRADVTRLAPGTGQRCGTTNTQEWSRCLLRTLRLDRFSIIL